MSPSRPGLLWPGRACRRVGTTPAVVLLAAILAGVSCTPTGDSAVSAGDSERAAGKFTVLASIEPLAYFVERVGGDLVRVEVLVPAGQSPATYEPTPRQMAALAESEAYFRIGVPFEKRLLEKIAATFDGLRIVDVREGITLRQMEHPHQDGGGDHSHAAGEPDPHCWLDPRLAKIMARNICRELCRIDPSHRADYERNLRAFQDDLDELHADIGELLGPLEGEEFFVFHPAYGYFADAYGLEQVAVESGGKEPGQKGLVLLIDRARSKGVRVIFAQPQFAASSAEMIAEAIGGEVVGLDPLAKDYPGNMREMASKIERAVRQPSSNQAAASGAGG